MKTFYCKICASRKKRFTGNRPMVREHIREEHLIKGLCRRNARPKDKYIGSRITESMGAEEE